MVEMTTKICDVCKTKVANKICSICSCDLCTNCVSTMRIDTLLHGYRDSLILEKEICSGCSKKVFITLDKKNLLSTEIQELIINFIRNNLITEELKEKEVLVPVTSNTIIPTAHASTMANYYRSLAYRKQSLHNQKKHLQNYKTMKGGSI